MHVRKVLVLAVIFSLLSTQALFGKKEEAPMKLNVRQQVDSEIHNLKKNLQSSKRSEQSWKFFEKSEKLISRLRSQNPRQFESDEVYMDLMMSSLAEIPRRAEFKIDQCDAYHSRILAHFDPQGSEKPSPPIAQSLSVLDLLCGTSEK